jgi:hypothetical protein
MIVYLAYEESGEYSDYSMGILGVFSSVEKAKESVEPFCQQQANRVFEFERHTWGDWKQDKENNWHREGRATYDRCSITIEARELDRVKGIDRR